MNSVLIVGGGLSGLAAAVALAQRNFEVTLLESRPRLGGRASSFWDRDTETWVDNCQHVSMGCCTNFNHFCREVGLSDLFRRESQLYFIGPQADQNRLKPTQLPAPFHLFPSFLKLSYLDWAEKRRLASALKKLARTPPQSNSSQTFDDWLKEQKQSTAAIERFWYPVLVSALSESLDRICLHQARQVFVKSFLQNRKGWEVLIPAKSLDELYGQKLIDWLAQHRVKLRLKSGVRQIITREKKVSGLELRDGEKLSADHYILAVPHHRLLPMLPPSLQTDPRLAALNQLETAPISSVHLWFDRPITPLPHAVFVERLSQWMFNRSVLQSDGTSNTTSLPPKNRTDHPDRTGENELFYYQVVISASRTLARIPTEETISRVLQEFQEVWPQTRQAELKFSRMVTEHRAVFSPRPGVDQLRPAQQSPLENLQFAGDWTQTGWPATMEGAVRSGYLAAENILEKTDRPEKLLQPDLPAGWLPRLFLGL